MNNSEHADEESHLAPWLAIPARSISVVEHPCIVKNPDKAITSLGGPLKLTESLRAKGESAPQSTEGPQESPPLISVSLRPEDPYARRLLATPVTIDNVLLKVTVPKRTGRKRKRGSSDPFLAHGETHSTGNSAYVKAQTVYRSLQDNADSYSVTPVGVIDEAHRFRMLPDIQVATQGNRLIKDLGNTFKTLKWPQIRDYNFNTEPGADRSQHVPLTPEFLQIPVQYDYKFQQNPYVKYTGDARTEINVQKRTTVEGYIFVDVDADKVPRRPKSSLPKESTLTAYMRGLIAAIRKQLDERPVITRLLLFNRLGWDQRDKIREAAVYCGYFFSSGPWRECLIRWGLDPRKDPYYRRYQTVSYMSFRRGGSMAKTQSEVNRHMSEMTKKNPKQLEREHIFDGETVGSTGNLFQFCDIKDPVIRKILDTDDIRETCSPTFTGWYHVQTWAKATVILKDKINRIIAGKELKPWLYERILTWSDRFDDREVYETYRDEMFDKELHRERLEEHRLLNAVRWAAKNPRYAFDRMQETMQAEDARGSEEMQEEVEEEEETDEEGEVDVPEDSGEERDEEAIAQEEREKVPQFAPGSEEGELDDSEDEDEGEDAEDEEEDEKEDEEEEEHDDEDEEDEDGDSEGDSDDMEIDGQEKTVSRRTGRRR
ncbi:uncharacterized protein EI97DRAFT_429646 [Westerdykella ornata]|uniref:RNA polymerase III transcription factor IIIC subunit n=1 Tax=Westerdykella ornata TaxID=318751 RepID=A0A6A6JTC2_WESOR|nr:uncharacterized protein EI97DRAFT_429646 [Westerdykella ornata]KAF2279861.1 hypothetical protein EI97DRAFT_429646 [Westerdykella ornata]